MAATLCHSNVRHIAKTTKQDCTMAATPHHSNVGHIVQITDYKTVQWLPHHIIPMWGTLTDHILAAGHSTGNLLAHAHQWMRVQFNSVSSVQQTFIFHKQYNFSGWLWVNFSKNSTLLLHPPPSSSIGKCPFTYADGT